MDDIRLHRVLQRDLFHVQTWARRPREHVRFRVIADGQAFAQLSGAASFPGEPFARELASHDDVRVFTALRHGVLAAVVCVHLAPGPDACASARPLEEPRVARLIYVSSRADADAESLLPALLEYACASLRRSGYTRCDARIWRARRRAHPLERWGWRGDPQRGLGRTSRGGRSLRWIHGGPNAD